MIWINHLLSTILCLHYFASHVICDEHSFRNFKPEFSKNKNKNSSSSNRSTHNFNSTKPECANYNNSSILCHSPVENNYNYKYVAPVPVPVNPYYQYYGSYDERSGKNYYIPPVDSRSSQNPPVNYYVNPYNQQQLWPRVDQDDSKNSGSSGHPGSHHEISYGPTEDHHQEMKNGWGWTKGHESHDSHPHHHEKEKKKKTKKGPLAKLLKKFKPKHKAEKLKWKQVPVCDGYENFIKDLEIISLGLGWAGFAKATLGFALHVLNQAYLTFSVIIVGLPERLTTFVDLIAPMTTPEQLRILLATIGLLDYVVNLTLSYPLGNLIVAIDFVAEILTLASLTLASITIFEDVVEEKVAAVFGIDLREVFEGYGCDNPFSKEKQIEEFFEVFNSWK